MPEEIPNYEEDAISNLSTDKLDEVATLAKELKDKEATVFALESQLEVAEKELNKVQSVDLPELLSILGISEVKLKDGSKLEISKVYAANISEARKDAAHKWLVDNGFGSLIKRRLVISTHLGGQETKEDIQKELDLTAWLKANDYDFEIEESVHHSTLASFVKGQLESTEETTVKPPMALFGIFVSDKATIKNKDQKTKTRKYKKK